jgi:ubiquinone/menaquinone biosynthesis C-methylase UbiE
MMEAKKEKYWSQYAYSYDEGVNYVVGKTLNQAIIERLSKEHLGDVIEFGCGSGYFTKAIAKNAKHVIATDLSDEMLEIAKAQLRELNNLTIEKADCEDSSFPSERFDSVFMANLIHVIENPINALQESYRVMKTGGLLLAVDYTGYSMNFFEKMKLSIRYLKQLGIPPRHVRSNISPDEFAALVKRAGFKVNDIQLIGDKTKALYLKCKKN